MNLPVEASEDEIVAAVRAANEDERVHGILVQVSLGRSSKRPGLDSDDPVPMTMP